MRLLTALMLCLAFIIPQPCLAGDDQEAMKKEIEALKARVNDLENMLRQVLEAKGAAPATGPAAAPQAAATAHPTPDPAAQKAGHVAKNATVAEADKDLVTKIEDAISERIGPFEISGSAVMNAQARSGPKMNGEKIDSKAGGDMAFTLNLHYKPTENGELISEIQLAEGKGAGKGVNDRLLANIDELSTLNTDGNFKLKNLYYQHNFFEGRFFTAFGKAEPEDYIDINRFANSQYTQFLSQIFVDAVEYDNEDEHTPFVAMGGNPFGDIHLVGWASSTTRSMAPSDRQKDAWDDIFDDPMLAAQVSWTPKFGELEGNYRFAGWTATYDHDKIKGGGTAPGWGLILNFDQDITKNVGVFGRGGYNSEDVYKTTWFWSLGSQITGIIPSRDQDITGLAIGGLLGNHKTDNDSMETHLEAYYRIILSKYFSLIPDVQYVINPGANDSNDGLFAGSVRAVFEF